LSENLVEANKRADSLARKLEQKEKALKKAESDAAVIEDLRKRLHEAETALSDKMAEQAAREKEILSRLQSQSRRFVSKYSNPCAFLRVASLSLAYLLTSFLLLVFRENASRV
jgi:DNA repair exonuclease SbcCD ATPase subunit